MPKVAVMLTALALVVTPAARPVCRPTVATTEEAEAQLAEVVTSEVVELLFVAIATNC